VSITKFLQACLSDLCQRALSVFHAVEEIIATVALVAMVALPLLEIIVRPLVAGGIPGSIPFVQHLTLWVAFLGATLAAKKGKLIALATGTFIPKGLVRRATVVIASAFGSAVCAILAWASIDVVSVERDLGTEIALGVPTWVMQLILPISFLILSLRLTWRAGGWLGRLISSLVLVAGLWLSNSFEILEGTSGWPWVALVIVAALVGAPIFTVLAGAAIFLYMIDFFPPAQVALYTYDLATEPSLPAIPLFTLAGFILAQGNVSERLLRFFRAIVGGVPGGTAVVCVMVCAFFSIFTGVSGITIVALGGVLLPTLLKDGYRDRFAVGLLTGSGSLGLLLAPAMPLILYAIVAGIPPRDLFIAGLLPGLLMIGLASVWGVKEGIKTDTGRQAFRWTELRSAAWVAKWELALPLVILTSYFSGLATLVETSALAALYAMVITVFVHRDFPFVRGLHKAATEALVIIGGVLIILAAAKGFTAYTLDADIPFRLLEWTKDHVNSPLVFLFALNIFLLIVGCLMDIVSAIFVIVPLITGIGLAFGIDPVHLGIIFIANLELGYLTPPVGLNLFFASYRFERPLLQVYLAALPMLAILGFGVLLITYFPWLSLGLLELIGRK
jgi:C4-dicarboxylate transporter DctM subunit